MVADMDTQASGDRRRAWRLGRRPGHGAAAPPGIEALRRRVLEEVPDLAGLSPMERRVRVAAIADRALGATAGEARASRLVELVDDLTGLGPLEALLADPSVTEIMVNGPDQVHVEVGGELRRSPVCFRDTDHVHAVVHRLLGGTGRRIDEGAPMVDARLEDGSRINAVLPPVACGSPLLTIRRPPRRRLGVEQLIELRAVDAATVAFLHAAVLGRCNVVVTGGAGTGKTTLLAALCELVPEGERLLLLEDVAEVSARHPHLVRQQCRPSAPDGGREVSLRDLVRNALRMRPDRLVVGEVRGVEAADMLAAMNTGHAGSMTTLHANSAADAVTRLEAMLAMALPSVGDASLQRWIASAIDLVVHCERCAGGHRQVTEVVAVDAGEHGRPQLGAVYARSGEALRPAGTTPDRCLARMRHHGVRFPVRLLSERGAA
ncbi:MAG: pilus assembly protein CpaF [Chloroflexota bacterium]|nr:pilus assembly protein CpaF [Chloroflexota bacterium]